LRCEAPAQVPSAESGQAARAGEALDRLAETARASGDWALEIEARSRALLSMDQAAEDLHREATRRLSRTGLHIDLARAQLLRRVAAPPAPPR
jgi:hypothetical protein